VIRPPSHLVTAVRGVPNPPCDGCLSRKLCATEQLACLDFARYVHCISWRDKYDRRPSRGRYRRIFGADE
jgi:hypothetical protein